MDNYFVKLEGIRFNGITGLLNLSDQYIIKTCRPKKSESDSIINISIITDTCSGKAVIALQDKLEWLYKKAELLPFDYIVQVIRGFAISNNLVFYIIGDRFDEVIGYKEDVQLSIYSRVENKECYDSYYQVAVRTNDLCLPVYSFRSKAADGVYYLTSPCEFGLTSNFPASMETIYIAMISYLLNGGVEKLVLEKPNNSDKWLKLDYFLNNSTSEALGKVKMLSKDEFRNLVYGMKEIFSIDDMTHPDPNIKVFIKRTAQKILGEKSEFCIKSLGLNKYSHNYEDNVSTVLNVLKNLTKDSIFTVNSKTNLIQFATIMYTYKLSNPTLPKPYLILPNYVKSSIQGEVEMLSKLFTIY